MSGKYINFKALTKIETAAGWDEEDLWLIFGDQKNDKNYYMSDEVFAQILIDKGLIPPGPIINTSFNLITGTTVQAVFNSIDSNFGITNAAVALNLLNINSNASDISGNVTNINTAQTTANNAFGLATSNQTAIGSIVSANGSVTTHNDVTNAGSGSIISTAERNNIAGSVTVHSDVTNAGSGIIISAGERTAISTNQGNINTNLAKISADGSISTHSDVTYSSLTTGQILLWSGTEWLNGAAPISADGLVTTHSDVTDAGSGIIISGAERTKLTNITVTQAVNLDTMESDIAALANGMVYRGDWDASSGSFPGGGSAKTGWFYYVAVSGSIGPLDFVVGDNIVATTDNASTSTYASNWSKHDQTDAVQSVVGIVGAISKLALLTALNVEDGADVTDTTNVTSAGALMDSEVTNLADIKAFDSTDYEPAKGVDDNFVTDAQLVTIGNTSGTNTGDQDLSGKQDVLMSIGSVLTSTGSVSSLEASGISPIATSGGAVDIIVDDAGGNSVSIGTEFKVFHILGANALTFSISGSQAIISVGSSLTSAGIGARMILTKYAANSWLLSGDI